MSGTDPSKDASASGDASAGVERLAAAMDVFLQANAIDAPEQRERFLAEHDDLRDLLEPMFDDSEHADEAPQQSVPIQAGLQIDDYRILREVGRGGMGTVFEAEQLSLKRRVALKVLHPHLSVSAGSIERFRREAASAARLRHPAIVPIHEVGEWRGLHFFSMEFVAGKSLKELVQEDRLGIRGSCSRAVERAELTARVADALEHAHEHGMVHRDVKPQNIMVGDDHVVRLLDFGLVKNLAEDSHSISGGFFGTPHYCSPEQAHGETVAGPTSDVFSLGTVLYELLARKRPFEGETSRAVLDRVELGDFEPLMRAAPSVPRDLRTICHKALEVNPAQRYQSAGAMAEDLRRFMQLKPILAKPRSAVSRAWKWTLRHRVRVALWSAALLLVGGGPIAYAFHLQGKAAAVARERQVVDQAEDLGLASIEQTLALLGNQLERLPDTDGTARRRADSVMQICNRYLALRSQDPERKRRVARSLYRLTFIYERLQQYTLAMKACDRSREIYENTPELASEYELYRAKLLRRQLCLRQVIDPTNADEAFELATEHWLEQLSGEGDEAALEYANTLLIRAQALADLSSRLNDAEQLLLKIEKLLPERLRKNPHVDHLHSRSRIVLGVVYLRTQRPKLALAEFEPMLAKFESQEKLPGSPGNGIDRARVISGIGEAQQMLGKAGAARSSLRKSIEMGERLLADYPGAQDLRRAMMASRLKLSILLVMKREVHEAERVLRAIVLPTDGDAVTAMAGNQASWYERSLRAKLDAHLATCLLMKSKGTSLAEARKLFGRACSLYEVLRQEQPDNLAFLIDFGGARNNLAAIANEKSEHAEAERQARMAIDCQRTVLARLPKNVSANFRMGMHHSQLALACGNQMDGKGTIEGVKGTMQYVARHPASLRLAAEGACVCANKLLSAADEDADAATIARADECAKFAVQALRKIAAVNSKEALRWVTHDRFASLRDRSDFQQLRAELRQ